LLADRKAHARHTSIASQSVRLSAAAELSLSHNFAVRAADPETGSLNG
jgi:hypothetical protein